MLYSANTVGKNGTLISDQTDLALQTHRMMLECESELGQEDVQYEVGELCCAKYKCKYSKSF